MEKEIQDALDALTVRIDAQAETFKVDKKEYRFTAPTFHLPGDAAPMTAEAALENKEVLKGLVEAKAGIIEEVL